MKVQQPGFYYHLAAEYLIKRKHDCRVLCREVRCAWVIVGVGCRCRAGLVVIVWAWCTCRVGLVLIIEAGCRGRAGLVVIMEVGCRFRVGVVVILECRVGLMVIMV